MKRPRWRPPSPGFVLILLTWAATAGLLAWGLQEPQLHRAWDLTARLELEDATPPTDRELAAVSRVLSAYPEWAVTLADGRPFAVLESPGSGCVRFETSHLMIPPSAGPVHLVLACRAAGGLEVSIVPPGAAPVSAQCGPQPQILTIPGAGVARLVPVRRSPGPNYGDDRTCPVFLVSRPEDLAAAPATEPPVQEEGDDAAKD